MLYHTFIWLFICNHKCPNLFVFFNKKYAYVFYPKETYMYVVRKEYRRPLHLWYCSNCQKKPMHMYSIWQIAFLNIHRSKYNMWALFTGRTSWNILVKISKLPLDFVNRKSCCSQLYRIIISLTYTTVFDKPQYMHFLDKFNTESCLNRDDKMRPLFFKITHGPF